jgi:hypothetical protein
VRGHGRVGDHRHFDQGPTVSRTTADAKPERCVNSSGRCLNDHLMAINQEAHRMLLGEGEIAGRVQEDIDGAGDGTATAVT